MIEAQASFVTPEATDQEASSERCSLDDGDVERNADLYVFNDRRQQTTVSSLTFRF